jgi:vacuolar-type H+-ATPase subunit I/STV1
MPIIQERQTMQDLRAAGFSQQQAEVLAAKLEATAQATQQDLKDFIRQEFAQFRQELNTRFAEMDVKFADVRTEMHATQKDLAFKLIATLVAGLSLAVAVIKLFPGAH